MNIQNLSRNLLAGFFLTTSFSYGMDPSLQTQIQELVKSNPYQLSEREYTHLAKTIEELAPCNVLVFGLGNDSVLWDQINAHGKTVFLEHNPEWYERITSKQPHLSCYFVQYHTQLSEWKILLNRSPVDLTMELSPDIMDTKWDLIFVDAPEGYEPSKPGRMQSIYMASVLGQKGDAHILVHDCDRPAEKAYCNRFLNRGKLIKSIDRLRHYKFEAQ